MYLLQSNCLITKSFTEKN